MNIEGIVVLNCQKYNHFHKESQVQIVSKVTGDLGTSWLGRGKGEKGME